MVLGTEARFPRWGELVHNFSAESVAFVRIGGVAVLYRRPISLFDCPEENQEFVELDCLHVGCLDGAAALVIGFSD